MLYLGESHLQEIGFEWNELTGVIRRAIETMEQGAFAQPLKPYLRYGDPRNRIIAMPAYIGGSIRTAGIKWIASFPGNVNAGLPRAHSMTILNDADTGVPAAVLNAPSVSAARTAAVSGLMLRHWLACRIPAPRSLRVGIIGWGPIGRFHAEMCAQLFEPSIERLYLYDIRGVDAGASRLGESALSDGRVIIAASWEELYAACDVVITCTVSESRYIDAAPAPGTLLLDVSLRDYTLGAIASVPTIVVDDWAEVCRENTDIELLHRDGGLRQEDTISLGDVVVREKLRGLDAAAGSVLFCPMGMAVFDVAVADWFVRRSLETGIGLTLE
ncbi:2,3-diaminopropionate biosynthesis protein SbnB [Paenibacillus soyae]|uniref:2,3-diaminopropionate biosynthesis protein SbnB n=1 Tax=Paenibacillus soyae TaxID=2969249 RepID=A0A9X2MV79_9BACL|nr:2,3-diaminopropionate biosynthesis protein SbnB [Paenibacillus soyae]MCR2804162.1 2,3-diaminopropionate biosynthesis protein SbnB [Paenibacillus soyae]